MDKELIKRKNNERAKLWAKKHPARKKLYDKTYQQLNKEVLAKKAKLRYSPEKEHERYLKNLDKHKVLGRARGLKRNFGITVADYEQMFSRQKGVCAICEKPETRRRLSVDHCHKTGKIRGLLCNKCNRGLGYFYDDKNLMKKATEYLKSN